MLNGETRPLRVVFAAFGNILPEKLGGGDRRTVLNAAKLADCEAVRADRRELRGRDSSSKNGWLLR